MSMYKKYLDGYVKKHPLPKPGGGEIYSPPPSAPLNPHNNAKPGG